MEELEKLKDQMLLSADDPTAPASYDFDLRGQLTLLTPVFFNCDPPIVGAREHMCLDTELTDDTGTTKVIVWDKACYTLFDMTAAGLRAKWEEGQEYPDKQVEILGKLNVNIAKTVRAVCTARLAPKDQKQTRATVRVNVNYLVI